jgi:phosphate transporter
LFNSYDILKRKIYELESVIDASRGTRGRTTERSALLSRFGHGSQSASTNDQFVPLLDHELDKITSFYPAQEHELKGELDELAANIARREEEGFNGLDHRFSDDGDSDDDDVSYGDITVNRNLNPSHWRKRSISRGSPVARRQNRSSGQNVIHYGVVFRQAYLFISQSGPCRMTLKRAPNSLLVPPLP